MEDLTYSSSDIAVEPLPAVLWREYNMILAFPFDMGHTLPILHNVLLIQRPSRGLPQVDVIFFHAGTAKPFQFSRPKAVAYSSAVRGDTIAMLTQAESPS